MEGVIAGVDRRTNLVGRNRLELLMFRLAGRQLYGINVFKVREVLKCPPLTRMPQSHFAVCGIVHIRGATITVLDLSLAIGGPPTSRDEAHVVVTEFNRRVQGFLVSSVDRIVNMNWEAILPPPQASGAASYMTAVTTVDDVLVEIIDVEKVLAEVTGMHDDVSESVIESSRGDVPKARVLVVDDSAVARKQITRTLDQIGIEHESACNGRDALDRLNALAESLGGPVSSHFSAVISDVEMPEMDGYTLCKAIKADPRLGDLWICLHTSLSGVFNQTMVQKVGADRFIAKFNADELGTCVLGRLQAIGAAAGGAMHEEKVA